MKKSKQKFNSINREAVVSIGGKLDTHIRYGLHPIGDTMWDRVWYQLRSHIKDMSECDMKKANEKK